MEDDFGGALQDFMGGNLDQLKPPKPEDPADAFKEFLGPALEPIRAQVQQTQQREEAVKNFPTDDEGFVKVKENDPENQATGFQAALGKYQKQYAEKGTGVGEFIGRNVLPFASSIVRQDQEKDYNDTLAKIKAGTATADDIENAAKFQAYQEHKGKSTTGEAVGTGLGQAAAFVGEFASGGKLLKPLGALAKSAPVLGTLAREGAILPQAAGALAKAGAMSAITPETLEAAQSRASETGGSKFDIKNLAPAAALSTIQNAILGQFGETAQGVPTAAGRFGARTAIGIGEQQIADAVAGATGLQTSYGAIPDLIAGKEGSIKHAATQFATFAVFAAKHGFHEQSAHMEEAFHDALKEAKAAGDPPDVAAKKATDAIAPIIEKMQVESESNRKPVESPKFDKPVNDAFNTHFKDVEAKPDGSLLAKVKTTDKAGKETSTDVEIKSSEDNPGAVTIRFTGTMGSEGTVTAEQTAAINADRVARGLKPVQAGVNPELKRHSIVLLKSLKGFISDLAQTGTPIEYDAKGEQRQEIYAKALKSLGYEQLKGPVEGSPRETYLWGPKPVPDVLKDPQGTADAAGMTLRIEGKTYVPTPTASAPAGTPAETPSGPPKPKIVDPGASGEPAKLAITPEMAASLERLGFKDPSKAPADLLEALRGEGKPVIVPQKAATPRLEPESNRPNPPVGMPKPKELTPISEMAGFKDQQLFREHLLNRIEAGEGKLTDKERAVLNERLIWGTSLSEVAGQVGEKSKQTVANIEKRALAKLGHSGTVEDLHAGSLGAQAMAEVQSGKEISGQGLHQVDPDGFHHNKVMNDILDAQDRLNELDREVAKAKKKGEVSDEQRAEWSAEYKRLGSVIGASQGELGSAGKPSAGEPAQAPNLPKIEGPAAGADQGAGAAGENARPGHPAGEPAQLAEGQAANPNPESGVMPSAEQRTSGLLGGGSGDTGTIQPKQRLTALANEQVDREREANGLPPLMDAARKSNPAVWDQAMSRLESDPKLSERLVDELAANPRATTVEENALLLHRKIALQNEHERAILDYLAEARRQRQPGADQDPAKLAELDTREETAKQMVDKIDHVTQATGTEWGRAGQFRKQLAAEDYSLSSMLGKAEKAKGDALTDAEKQQIADMAQKIKDLQAELDRMGERSPEAQDTRIEMKQTKSRFQDLTAAYTRANMSVPRKVFEATKETLNLSRSLITSMDLSATLRQGGFTTFSHPIMSAKAMPEMLRAFASQHGADVALDALGNRPNYPWYKRAGLFIAEPGSGPTRQEEAYIGRWVKKIPGVAGSERAYTTFLNRMRADVFDSMAGSFGKKGSVTDAQAKVIANFVNAATGRGNLGAFEKAAVPLAQVFFSPRYLASRLQIISGQPMWKGDMTTRRLIAGEYARAVAGLGLFYGLTKLALGDDADISFDPRSTDFGKVKMGHTRLDPLTGLGQIATLIGRVGSGQERTASGKLQPIRGPKVPYGGDTAPDLMARFVRGKLAPLPGAAVDVMAGKNIAGEPVTARGEASNLLLPMSFRDVYEAMQDQGIPRGAAIGLLSILGMGSQTYGPKPKKRPVGMPSR